LRQLIQRYRRHLGLIDPSPAWCHHRCGDGKLLRECIIAATSGEESATREFKLLINGELVSGAARLDVINPATEDVLAEAPRADRVQLDEAVAAAKAAFPAWSAKPIPESGALLGKFWMQDMTNSHAC
jgi:delta 1-pyrroline-5-carboxylate dehydrogenase